MPDSSRLEDAPAPSHDVMTRHTGRLVDDDKTGVHSVIAVSTRSRSTDHRPAKVLSGGPASVSPSIRIVDSNPPAEPESSMVKVICASSKPSQRLVSGNH